jgi:uncharacterized protein YjbI with pentapeptide repeats
MANKEHLEILKFGVDAWNREREHGLRNVDLLGAELSGLHLARYNLSYTDLRGANLEGTYLNDADLRSADLRNANLIRSSLSESNLRYANLEGANLMYANLAGSSLIGTKVNHAIVSGSYVYGINVWDLEGEFGEQKDLIVSPLHNSSLLDPNPAITVDNIKVAQFIYLILNNEEIREVINVITSKSVLILGRFADDKRKEILDALRNKLREFNLLPIVFDFDRPINRDYTEVAQTLAGLSLFVIVDVTSPKSTPLEMEATVKHFKIPYLPIIDLSVDARPFAMIVDSQKSFHWVLPTYGYKSKEELLDNLEDTIINRALKKHNELKKQKATEPEILTVDDLKKDKK